MSKRFEAVLIPDSSEYIIWDNVRNDAVPSSVNPAMPWHHHVGAVANLYCQMLNK